MRILACLLTGLVVLQAQPPIAFSDRVQKVLSRSEYRHSRFGIEVFDIDHGRVLYQLNSEQLFIPGSTTKLLTVATAITLLGQDHRFHTSVFRGGPLEHGRLKGDLILVAAGDPNLSNRLQPDGTLAFRNIDHSYSGLPGSEVVEGDPSVVLRDLARQVAARGVKHIDGSVRVDISLFPEGERELGTGVVLSPIIVNDNVVDVTISPGPQADTPAVVSTSPETGYVTFVNHAKTGAPGSAVSLDIGHDDRTSSGAHSVIVEGALPLGSKPVLRTYRVPEPSAFAATLFAEALRKEGIKVGAASSPITVKPAQPYLPEAQLAEHISAPFSEEAKVTLKVSQNLHASIFPYLVGAVVGHAAENTDQAGFDLEHGFLEKAGLDVTAAAQSDGAGGAALFTPDFMVRFLVYLTKQAFFPAYFAALPVLGKDGTLWDIQVNSPAAGHVMAKTGTYGSYNALDKNLMVDGKGLAGYVKTKDGRTLAIAAYANFVAVDPAIGAHLVGDALGEIAAAAYDAPFE
jgi:D-alanyl-D-alanine carboxypeptidase/D-alanyl-D-alanine-endopeptidase (penicillin-binding protein 4)